MRLLALLLIILPILADAQPRLRDPIGRVITTRNDAVFQGLNNLLRIAQQRMEIYAGDNITTGPNIPIQMRMRDAGNIRLACNSELQILEYSSNGTDAGNIMMEYKRGGVMIVSGAPVGDSFELHTPFGQLELGEGVFEIEQETSAAYLVGIYQGEILGVNSETGLRLGNVRAESFLRITLNGNVETINRRDLLLQRERNCSAVMID